IVEENNYYPFGLKHKGYNNVKLAEFKYKTYQGQEFTDDLGLNIHEWKYRISDPAIARFWQIDPLAEKYTYNSTYAFQENKLGLGVELEGLEVKRQRGGLEDMGQGGKKMIGEMLNVKRQMDKRGFSGGEQSFVAKMESRSEMSEGAEQLGNGHEDFAKGSTYVLGEALEMTGERAEEIGITTGFLPLAEAGAGISATGTLLQGAVDLSDGKDVTDTVIDVGIVTAIGQTGKALVKQAEKAAGEALDKVSKIVIEATVKTWEVITEKIIIPSFSD
ncbi:MAG: hypothetical protein GY756_02505, partial [bacterium]|nr:hypothetical protein [bacterium]